MSDKEARIAADVARAEASWGMPIIPDDRPAGPVRLAWEAHQRGDKFFQVDVPISYTQANSNRGLATASRAMHPPMAAGQEDFLGQIEAFGWRLEHVSTSFVSQGYVASPGNYQGGYHGVLTALYVFRRSTQ